MDFFDFFFGFFWDLFGFFGFFFIFFGFFVFLILFWIVGFFEFLVFFWVCIVFFLVSFKVTKVTTKYYHGYYWTPKIAKNGPKQHKKALFLPKGKKIASAKALRKSYK